MVSVSLSVRAAVLSQGQPVATVQFSGGGGAAAAGKLAGPSLSLGPVPGRSSWREAWRWELSPPCSCRLCSEPSTMHCLSMCQAFPKNCFISFSDHHFGGRKPVLRAVRGFGHGSPVKPSARCPPVRQRGTHRCPRCLYGLPDPSQSPSALNSTLLVSNPRKSDSTDWARGPDSYV